MRTATPRVLFLTGGTEDYLADSLMHGLRSVLGASLVDVPKRESMYASYPAEQRHALYGRGFTLYGLLEDIEIERDGALEEARNGHFDLVVFADVWRTLALIRELLPDLERRSVAHVFVDGRDSPALFGYGPHWWRRHAPWRVPPIHGRAPYFKREITPGTWFWRYYMTAPPPLDRVLPLGQVRPISFSIPRAKVVDSAPAKDKELGAHIVDAKVAEHVAGAGAGYRFEREEDYFDDLRRSRFAVTTKRAGWDCLRHYEIAASGCVPCFRRLDRKPELCAPHGLGPGNCIAYSGYDDLRRRLDSITDSEYEELQSGAIAWALDNTTVRRAEQLLAAR